MRRHVPGHCNIHPDECIAFIAMSGDVYGGNAAPCQIALDTRIVGLCLFGMYWKISFLRCVCLYSTEPVFVGLLLSSWLFLLHRCIMIDFR